MRMLSAPELLDVWERGLGQPPVQRALSLLAAACPEMSPEVLAALSLGQRDAYLLTLREWMFGPQLTGLATCSGCGERLELTCQVAEIRAAPAASQQEEGGEALSLTAAGYAVRFRLPDSSDLAALADQTDLAAARQQLLDRCLLAVQHDGEEAPTDRLPAPIVEAIVERMAQADPQADVRLALTCPACGNQWLAAFDIASFFWNEINAWAVRLLGEVHTLASAYGWRETDILALSPWRRQMYLEMVRG